MPATVHALRDMLEHRFPDAVPAAHRTRTQVPTGLGELDRILPAGGLPRGKLSLWRRGGGATALLRAAAAAVEARGEGAAWIDGDRTVAAQHWPPGPALLRPGDRSAALACAEELLRCGAFALVVLDGADPADAEAVRLGRAAREGDAALLCLAAAAPPAALRLRSRLPVDGWRWRPAPCGAPADPEAAAVHVHAAALGWSADALLSLPVLPHDLRLSLAPGPDRRGLRA